VTSPQSRATHVLDPLGSVYLSARFKLVHPHSPIRQIIVVSPLTPFRVLGSCLSIGLLTFIVTTLGILILYPYGPDPGLSAILLRSYLLGTPLSVVFLVGALYGGILGAARRVIVRLSHRIIPPHPSLLNLRAVLEMLIKRPSILYASIFSAYFLVLRSCLELVLLQASSWHGLPTARI